MKERVIYAGLAVMVLICLIIAWAMMIKIKNEIRPLTIKESCYVQMFRL